MPTKKTKKIIENIISKMFVSLIVIIVLAIFFNGFKTYGALQITILIILHIVSLSLLSQDINSAKIAIWLGIIWNSIIVVYTLNYINSHPLINTEGFGSVVGGGVYLIFTYIYDLIRIINNEKNT